MSPIHFAKSKNNLLADLNTVVQVIFVVALGDNSMQSDLHHR